MMEYIIENLNNCCDEFQKMLLEDQYITRKQFELFLEKYKDTFILINKGYVSKTEQLYKKVLSITNDGYNIISKRNNVFLERKLKELSDYFDNVFLSVDPAIKLDEEQRKAIISDEDYSLIISGPGTGKTTVALGKIKYLVDILHKKPEEIVLVSSTKRKAKELKDIINNIFKINVNVLTFDELCLFYLNQLYDKPYKVFYSEDLEKFVSSFFKTNIFENKEKFNYYVNVFNNKIYINDEYKNYDNYNDYYMSIVDNQYKLYKNDIDKFIYNKINSNQKDFKSIKGEKLRSFNEVRIANYLYVNGIEYEYYMKDNIFDYVADFIINTNGKNIYIEYYGLTTLKPDGTYALQDLTLRKNLKIKQSFLHKKYGENLIELFSNTDYIDILDQELSKRNVKKKIASKKKIFYQLLNQDNINIFNPLIDEIVKFINRFKEKNYNINDFDRLIKNAYNDKIKKQLLLIKDIYELYEQYMLDNMVIDFNDIINKATNSLEKLKHDKKSFFSYIIIDDYQDFSVKHNSFAQKVSTLYNSKIVALGDDWEMLYGLDNNDINIFNDFYNVMGYANILKVGKSYRSSKEIIDIAMDVIGDNYDTFSKTLVTCSNEDKPLEIIYYLKDNISEKYLALHNALLKIYKANKNHNVLILSAFSNDINEYINNDFFTRGSNGLIICNDIPKLHIEFHTPNETSGMEYDQVILLTKNSSCMFEEEDELLKILDNVKENVIENIFDRRLFYMALTRTKNKLYIISSTKNRKF